jgi:hypothetical protein
VDFRDVLDLLGINANEAAELFGVSPQTIRQMRLDPGKDGYRAPPADWVKKLSPLIVERRKEIGAVGTFVFKEIFGEWLAKRAKLGEVVGDEARVFKSDTIYWTVKMKSGASWRIAVSDRVARDRSVNEVIAFLRPQLEHLQENYPSGVIIQSPAGQDNLVLAEWSRDTGVVTRRATGGT